jgi:hypothetical protein
LVARFAPSQARRPPHGFRTPTKSLRSGTSIATGHSRSMKLSIRRRICKSAEISNWRTIQTTNTSGTMPRQPSARGKRSTKSRNKTRGKRKQRKRCNTRIRKTARYRSSRRIQRPGAHWPGRSGSASSGRILQPQRM